MGETDSGVDFRCPGKTARNNSREVVNLIDALQKTNT